MLYMAISLSFIISMTVKLMVPYIDPKCVGEVFFTLSLVIAKPKRHNFVGKTKKNIHGIGKTYLKVSYINNYQVDMLCK